MEKKTECQVVQDLLLGYVDNVLNEESKKLVEKHLAECEICQERLKEIDKDIKENQNNEKKQIDYLKKLKRKNRRKSILMVIGILIGICFIIYLRNFIIFNNLMHKAKKNLESNNIYIEKMNRNQDNICIEKRYYKDGKLKIVYGIYSEDGFKEEFSIYKVANTDREITIYPDKRAIITKGDNIKNTNKEEFFKNISSIIRDDRIFVRIAIPALATLSIQNYTYDKCSYSNYNQGKEYYMLKSRFKDEENHELWFDNETGLVLKEVNKEGGASYYLKSVQVDNDYIMSLQQNEIQNGKIQDNRIIKERYDNIDEFNYQFDIVTDEDVTAPDLTEYQVEEHAF